VAFVLTDDLGRLADPPKVIGVRLVPPHDPLLMAHDRDNIVARQHHSRLWRSAHNPGVVLGAAGVIATWTSRKQARHLNITIEPLGSAIDRATRDAIENEAAITAELRGCDDARLEVAS
jgi:winged helix DNA-binding protein